MQPKKYLSIKVANTKVAVQNARMSEERVWFTQHLPHTCPTLAQHLPEVAGLAIQHFAEIR